MRPEQPPRRRHAGMRNDMTSPWSLQGKRTVMLTNLAWVFCGKIVSLPVRRFLDVRRDAELMVCNRGICDRSRITRPRRHQYSRPLYNSCEFLWRSYHSIDGEDGLELTVSRRCRRVGRRSDRDRNPCAARDS